MPVVNIESKSHFDQVLKSAGDKKILIDFFATWCGPCKMISPKLEELSNSYTNLVYVKLDVDEVDNVAEDYDVSAMPTFIIVNNKGDKIDTLVGASKEKLEDFIKAHS